jgi:hypothetical protein
VLEDGVQLMVVQPLDALAVWLVHEPGVTLVDGLVLGPAEQVVTVKLALVPEVQVATGAGVVGPFMAQVVAVQAFADEAATGEQLPRGTPVGPVVTAAGHLMVT